MTQSHSKSRQTAEIAFNSLQAPFFARNHAMDELEAITQSRDAKTQRLREARQAKELADQAAATSALLAKRNPMR
ncbi:hypothetical protein [Endobacterium cereale]|uniref:hypothetical protein n=1 Tax=Endobacterium cereale TaxID=2663029 RepID=UPI002B474AFC|nr:hypothetical protein [Endobacterium cereale]MEB2846412.1 hypothetical protein [Endobacterium cereale]